MSGAPFPKSQQARKARSIGARSRAQVDLVRESIFNRDGRECLAKRSGTPCLGQLTVQHAAGRGMGGSALFDGAAWLRTMCWGHNRLETSDADFAALCHANGWSVDRLGDVDPERVVVRYPDGNDFTLSHTGFGLIYLTPDRAAQLREEGPYRKG